MFKIFMLINIHNEVCIPIIFRDHLEETKIGKRGRPKNPAIVPDENLRYAQVIKNRKEGSFMKLKKELSFVKI